jgi:hypothetical protein
MTGNKCPMLKSDCIDSDCAWFLEDANACTLVSLANNLSMVTYPQMGGGSLKVVDG